MLIREMSDLVKRKIAPIDIDYVEICCEKKTSSTIKVNAKVVWLILNVSTIVHFSTHFFVVVVEIAKL